MKKLLNNRMLLICVALPLLFMVGGCKKFLDRKPLTATLDDIKQGGIEGLVFGLYSTVKDYDNGQCFGGIPWQAMHNFRSDDSKKGSEPADGAEWVAPFDDFKYVKDLWASNFYWDAHYALIHLANTALQTADSLKLTGNETNANIAEARFFRAFSYFDLVRVFGEVPKIDFRLFSASQANVAKTSVANIYALIDGDLNFAISNLPTAWGSKYPGRLTSGAAKSLLAKAHLFRGNWAQANSLCQQVINSAQYSLSSSYAATFKDAGENNSESILEWQNYMGPNRTDDRGSWYATCQGVRASNASGWNLGWGWNVPTDVFVNSFETGDPRKGSTILFTGQSDDLATGGYGSTLPSGLAQPYWNKKVYADPAMRQFTGYLDGAYWINQRVIRYADVLLMAAESANELGNGAAGTNYLNQVRTRVGMATIPYTTQAKMRTDLKKERRSELGLEGERFFDLVRWGDANSVLGPLGYVDKCKYYPIPQPAIDKSSGVLVQNPQW
jgi:starch-binding outer membrane protein, SusD/RagB family